MDSIAYETGRRSRRSNALRSENPYGRVLAGLVPARWRMRAILSWAHGWDDQDDDLAMEMS